MKPRGAKQPVEYHTAVGFELIVTKLDYLSSTELKVERGQGSQSKLALIRAFSLSSCVILTQLSNFSGSFAL